MTVAQCNGARFSLSCRFKCVPARPSSVIVHSSSPGPPRVAEKAAAFPEIVEYNGQKPVARLGKDGSVEEASADAIGESNQQLSNTPIIRRAQEAASDLLARCQREHNSIDHSQALCAELFLPTGYPDTLTPDYLQYQLWALPVHVTGWVANSLATSSMLKAAGLGSSAAGAVAAGAAIKWITKDGIGALGRVLVGGGLARFFDEDPRFWRFWADVVKCFGQALEVATPLYPDMFILLAGAGNFTKAAGKGISRPAFRVIQQHFATGGNVGDVAAREEVWEVAGQLAGLALSVGILQALDTDGIDDMLPVSPAVAVIVLWLASQMVHISLRYKSLSVLQLPWISQARAVTLARAFVRSEPLPTVQQLSVDEPFATPKQLLQPRISTNATLKDLETAAATLPFSQHPQSSSCSGSNSSSVVSNSNSNGSVVGDGKSNSARSSTLNDSASANGAMLSSKNSCSALQQALEMYGSEDYVLLPCDDGEEFVMGVKDSCAEHSMSKAQAVLQAVWYNTRRLDFQSGPAGDLKALTASLQYVKEHRGRFEEELSASGWQTDAVLMCSQSKAILRVV